VTIRAQRQTLTTDCAPPQRIEGSIEIQLRDPDGHIALTTGVLRPHGWHRLRETFVMPHTDQWTVAIALRRERASAGVHASAGER
jgi:hypothetical protein